MDDLVVFPPHSSLQEMGLQAAGLLGFNGNATSKHFFFCVCLCVCAMKWKMFVSPHFSVSSASGSETVKNNFFPRGKSRILSSATSALYWEVVVLMVLLGVCFQDIPWIQISVDNKIHGMASQDLLDSDFKAIQWCLGVPWGHQDGGSSPMLSKICRCWAYGQG